MIPKFFVLAVCCIFVVRMYHVHCQDSQIIMTPPAETESKTELTNVIASKTINTLLRHLRIEMIHPVSASVIRDIVTAFRIVLTDETGQKIVQNLTDFIVDTLMDSNTLVTVKVLRERLVQLAASGRNAPIILQTAAEATRKILDEPQLLAATEGAIEGINILLEDMTEQKLREGISRVAKLQKLASFFKPKANNKIPPALQKLKKSNSDAQVDYQSIEVDREMQLQTRSVNHWNGDEYGWINKQPKLNKSKGKDSFDDVSGNV